MAKKMTKKKKSIKLLRTTDLVEQGRVIVGFWSLVLNVGLQKQCFDLGFLTRRGPIPIARQLLKWTVLGICMRPAAGLYLLERQFLGKRKGSRNGKIHLKAMASFAL